MEINFRDLLVIVGVLVVLGVLADGLRRMWLAKRRANELNFGLEEIQGCEEGFGSELPNGGARLLDGEEEQQQIQEPVESRIRREPLIAAEALDIKPDDRKRDNSEPGENLPGEVVSAPRVVTPASEQVKEAAYASRREPAVAAPKSEPKHKLEPAFNLQPEPDLEPELNSQVAPKPVSALRQESIESVEIKTEPATAYEPLFSFSDKTPEPVISHQPEPVMNRQSVEIKAEASVFEDAHLSIKPEAEEIEARSEVIVPTESVPKEVKSKEPAPRRKRFFERSHFHWHKEPESEKADVKITHESAEQSEPETAHYEPVDEVLIMNLVAPKGMPFSGGQVLASFQRVGLRFGDMNIFHRHVREDGTGEVLFSVASGVEPGTFNLKTMDESYIPAISFFLGLPGPREPLQAFRVMVEAIHHIAQDLEGTLRDDQHSVLTQQTLEHYRQRICDFERHQLTRRNKSTAKV